MSVEVICHYSLFEEIVLVGNTKDTPFICIITKIEKKNLKKIIRQSEACIYIKGENNIYYCIQVTLISSKDKFSNSDPKSHIKLLKEYARDSYDKLSKNNSEMVIKEKNNKFLYFLYDIPAYIWCVVVGMLTTEL